MDFQGYSFSAVPVNGGAALKLNSSIPTASFSGLTPNTRYLITAVGILPGGAAAATSAALQVNTPNK